MRDTVVMLRSWQPLAVGGTYSASAGKGLGGTDSQLLLHSAELKDLGYKVTVLGVTSETVEECGVTFQGARSAEETLKWLRGAQDRIVAIFVNPRRWIERLKDVAPGTVVVQVCQNGPFLELAKHIDIFAMASTGQMALYCVREPRHRGKFMLLPNAVAWDSVYGGLDDIAQRNQIVWVGAYEKQGLRRWGKAMSGVMQTRTELVWKLYAPCYSITDRLQRPAALAGLSLQWDRMELGNLPIDKLAVEIASSKMLLASLGGEDGGITYLDGHAAGVPVLSGDDIMAKYWNPEGTGLRCTTWQECQRAIEFVVDNPAAAATMGANGRSWVKESFSEGYQAECLRQIMSVVNMEARWRRPEKVSAQSDRKFSLRYRLERLEIKLANRLARRGQS